MSVFSRFSLHSRHVSLPLCTPPQRGGRETAQRPHPPSLQKSRHGVGQVHPADAPHRQPPPLCHRCFAARDFPGLQARVRRAHQGPFWRMQRLRVCQVLWRRDNEQSLRRGDRDKGRRQGHQLVSCLWNVFILLFFFSFLFVFLFLFFSLSSLFFLLIYPLPFPIPTPPRPAHSGRPVSAGPIIRRPVRTAGAQRPFRKPRSEPFSRRNKMPDTIYIGNLNYNVDRERLKVCTDTLEHRRRGERWEWMRLQIGKYHSVRYTPSMRWFELFYF